MSVKILLFEHEQGLRETMEALIGAAGDYTVVCFYGSLNKLRSTITSTSPNLVIMDIHQPLCDGISAIPAIKAIRPDLPVIVYTWQDSKQKLFDSLSAGADGYILKSTSPLRLLKAISQVLKGGAPMSPKIAKMVLASFHKKKGRQENDYKFTKRETEVIQLLIQGYSVKSIATSLDMAFDTCRTHLRNVYKKLNVNCGKEAIAKLLQEKMFD